jgi:acyl-CoA thioesterase-1
MRSRFGFVGLLLALAGCGAGGEGERDVRAAASATVPPADSAAAQASRTILFIGTSLTAGLGLEPEESYPALIQHRIDSLGLDWRVVNAGVSGETSAGALRRIDWVLREPAAVIVVETGANDGLRGLSVDSMRANIQTILDRIEERQPRARVLLAAMEAPPNLGPRYTSGFRRVFPELAERNDVTLIPFFLEEVAGRAALNQADGMHPNADGARVAAAAVWDALEPVLRDAGAPVDASP